MQKIIKINNKTIVILDSGVMMEQENLTDEELNTLYNASSDEEVFSIMNKQYKEKVIEAENVNKLIYYVNNSNILSFSDNGIYWEDISPLSVPTDLANDILEAEANNDELKLETYKNFWTLMSLNTDEDCRINLYAFLRRHDFKLSRCGFFVGYRNVDKTKEEGVYTDHHSHTFRIEIGKMVTMDKSKCDCDSNNECSRGLHVSSTNWLTKNYYGDTGLVVLVNPVDVVAVPKRSSYGKLRCCAYLPIDTFAYNVEGNIIPFPKDTGFDCEYVPQVIYEGLMGTESDTTYKIEIPEIPGFNKESISDKLLDIAREAVLNRVVNE